MYKCDNCKELISYEPATRIDVHGERYYICPECGMDEIEQVFESFMCRSCEGLYHHYEIDTGTEWQCPDCGAKDIEEL